MLTNYMENKTYNKIQRPNYTWEIILFAQPKKSNKRELYGELSFRFMNLSQYPNLFRRIMYKLLLNWTVVKIENNNK